MTIRLAEVCRRFLQYMTRLVNKFPELKEENKE